MQFYRLDATAATIAAALGADRNGDVWPGGAVVPSGFAPVAIRGDDGGRRLVPRQWGVPPPPRGQHPVTTVRNLASPFWIGTLRHTQLRCLVPMTAMPGPGGDVMAMPDTLPGAPVFVAAGIWRDSEVVSFAILTAADAAGRIGPVLLHRQEYALWLSADWKVAQRLVQGR